MIPHIDLLIISLWFQIRITWSLYHWIALIKDCLSYTNQVFPFVVIDKLFSNKSKSTKHWDTFATHCRLRTPSIPVRRVCRRASSLGSLLFEASTTLAHPSHSKSIQRFRSLSEGVSEVNSARSCPWRAWRISFAVSCTFLSPSSRPSCRSSSRSGHPTEDAWSPS